MLAIRNSFRLRTCLPPSTKIQKRNITVYYHPHYHAPLPPNHSFPIDKYPLLYEILKDEKIINDNEFKEPSIEVGLDDLSMVHYKEYIEKVVKNKLSEQEVRKLGFPCNDVHVRRWKRSVQGTIEAAYDSFTEGITFNIAGGYHHAFPDHGEGFCAFNDIGIALKHLHYSGKIKSSLVVDLDVHQGNGTAAVFKSSNDVYTFSMHCDSNYPMVKESSSLDVPVPVHANDELYLSLLQTNMRDIVSRRKNIDFVMYVAGVDVAQGDRWGKLSLTPQGIAERDRLVLEFFHKRYGIPVTVLTAGGYAKTPKDTAMLHSIVFKEAKAIVQ